MSPINLLPEEEKKPEKKVKEEEKVEIKVTKPLLDEKPVSEEKKMGWFGFGKPQKAAVEPKEEIVKPIAPEPEVLPESEKIKTPSYSGQLADTAGKEEAPKLAEILAEEPILSETEEKTKKEEQGERGEKSPKFSFFSRFFARGGFAFGGKKEEAAEQPSGSLEISLMPERAVVIPRIIRERTLVLISVVVILGTAISLINLYINWHFEKLKTETEKLKIDSELMAARSNPYLEMRDKMIDLVKKQNRVKDILANHVYWTKFFSLLETYTIPEVYYKDFSADTSGAIHLAAVGKNLISVAKQIVAFSNAQDFVRKVEVGGIVQTTEGIDFTVKLDLADGVFLR